MGSYSLNELEEQFAESLPDTYSVAERRIEKHGSWQWVARRSNTSDGVRRFVYLFATWLGRDSMSSPFHVDVVAAANDGARFRRIDLFQGLVKDFDSLTATLRKNVPAAATRADNLAGQDLTEGFAP